MAQCPNCHRPIVTVNFKKCLYCNATLDDQLLSSIEPPDMKRIQAMLMIHQEKDKQALSTGYRLARWFYALFGVLCLMTGLWLGYYGIRKGPMSSPLAVFLSVAILAVAILAFYKTIRPQPTLTSRSRKTR